MSKKKITVIIAIVVPVLIAGYFVASKKLVASVENVEEYSEVINSISHHEAITDKIGEVQRVETLPKVKVSNIKNKKQAEISTKFYGEKGKIGVKILANKSLGKWELESYEIIRPL